MSNIRSTMMHRRSLLLAGASLFASAPALAAAPELTVYKSPSCGCCRGWITHMARAGFRPKVIETEDLAPVRARLGVPDSAASCHTATVGGYFVEGHVPAGDVQRLLRERPKARGIAVPGMPIGSPGMESPTGEKQAYQTLLITASGPRVFARH